MINLKQLKKIFIVLVLVISIHFMNSVAYAKEQLPNINFVGMEHSPLVEGDSQSIYVTSDFEGTVQYRVWLNKVNTNTWEDITDGYTKAVDAKIPYVISPDRKFTEGKYKLSVWVKRAELEGVNKGSQGSYDTYYITNLNCVKKDDNNRVYVSNAMDIEKEVYTLGEKVIINGIMDIAGIKGPYKYKLHYFSPNKANDKDSGWVKNVTDYSDKIEWIPTEPGIYVLDVHVNTEKSTTWNTYIKKKKENKLDDVKGTYEAWKLKVITVKEKTQDEKSINLNEPNQVYGSLDESSPKIMDKEINFFAESVTLKNIKQMGNINMLKDKGLLNNAEVIGDINILGNYVKLNNVKVKGTITINPGNSGVVYLDDVQADEIQILSGATESIYLNNVTTPAVIINSNSNVRVESSGKTIIDKVAIKSNAILENVNANIKEVEIMPENSSKINLKGNYEIVNIIKATDLNVLAGKINKMYTTSPFTLKVEEGAFIAELDKNNLEVNINATNTSIGIVKNDTTVINPGGSIEEPVIPPSQDKLLKNISVVLSNGQVVNGSGTEGEIYVDLSTFDELLKLVHIDIEVSKNCDVNIKDSTGFINVNFSLSAGKINQITPNELSSWVDSEKDGISILKMKTELILVDGYFSTTQTLTLGNETMQVVLKIKVI